MLQPSRRFCCFCCYGWFYHCISLSQLSEVIIRCVWKNKKIHGLQNSEYNYIDFIYELKAFKVSMFCFQTGIYFHPIHDNNAIKNMGSFSYFICLIFQSIHSLQILITIARSPYSAFDMTNLKEYGKKTREYIHILICLHDFKKFKASLFYLSIGGLL